VNVEYYEYEAKRTFKEYFFYSEGAKGQIRKVVQFNLLYNYPTPIYNLVFGDRVEAGYGIDTKVISNNGDVKKILATVGRIIIHFTGIFKNIIVHIKGDGAARARLYQIGVNRYWREINKVLYIYVYTDKQIRPFQKDTNYTGFLISREEHLIRLHEYFILEEQNEIYMRLKKKFEETERVYNCRVIDGPEEVDRNSPAIREKNEEAIKALEKLGFAAAGFCMKPELEQE